MSRSKYTRELLAPLVASSSSYSQVIRKLGLEPNGGYHRLISSRIRQLELDVSHFTSGRSKAVLAGLSREQLQSVVSRSTSVAGVLASLGLPSKGVHIAT